MDTATSGLQQADCPWLRSMNRRPQVEDHNERPVGVDELQLPTSGPNTTWMLSALYPSHRGHCNGLSTSSYWEGSALAGVHQQIAEWYGRETPPGG